MDDEISTRNNLGNLYEVIGAAGARGWLVNSVVWNEFKDFHQALKDFENAIKLHELDDVWASPLAFYKSLRYILATTPLPPLIVVKKLRLKFPTSSHHAFEQVSQKNLFERHEKLKDTFYQIGERTMNPLWNSLLSELWSNNENTCNIINAAFFVRDRYLLNDIIQILNSPITLNIQFTPVTAVSLKQPKTYDKLIIFGPVRQIELNGSGFIFKSPRAVSLDVFTPAVFPTAIPCPYDFLGSPHIKTAPETADSFKKFAPERFTIIGESINIDSCKNVKDPDDEWTATLPTRVIPKYDFETLTSTDDSLQEKISAKQLILSGGYAVYLNPDGSIYRVLTQDQGLSNKQICVDVEHVDVTDIGSGDILLFQAQGGGDMISEIADHILGEKQPEVRALQSLWKAELGKRVCQFGTELVARDLAERGVAIASPGNVRNWTSLANIGPGSWKNFEIILEYCGLNEKIDQVFIATKLIRSACQTAGFKLAGKLLEIMQGKELSSLYENGKQEFSGIQGAPNSKVAFYVKSILCEPIEVIPNHLQRPFLIDSRIWL